MLESTKISRDQSTIRQQLAELAAKPEPNDDELRSMADLDKRYQANEVRFRAALTAEDDERREAGADLETREGRERADLLRRFELRQAVLALDNGSALTGPTGELVQEMRAHAHFRGVPIPLEALETRAGETIASGTPAPVATMDIVDRLFAPTAAARLGVASIQIPYGEREWPIVSSAISAGWAATETGNVAGPTAFATTPRSLAPDYTYGVMLKVTRKAMLQSGPGLEAAIRRDLSSAITVGLDHAVFQGSGTTGEPHGLVAKANATYGITETPVDAPADWAAFREAIVGFMTAAAASGPGDVRVGIRPELWSWLDGRFSYAALDIAGPGPTELDRLMKHVGAVVVTTNALNAPSGSGPLETEAILTTSAGGMPPAYVGLWSGIDLIRDVFTDAQSGGLRLTGLITADVTATRAEQVQVLTGLYLEEEGGE